MKGYLLLICLMLLGESSFSQYVWGINFDTPLYIDRIVRDTITNPNCIWQIGHPNKPVFNSAYTAPNAIVTDTLNPIPSNDTSIFYLKHVRDNSLGQHHFVLNFHFKMDGDSTDFGKIEISPDTGNTWINLLTQDTTFQMIWQSTKPTLSGSASGWQTFNLNMMLWASINTIFPIQITADTILFRFTYITGGSSDPHDGWMIDNIQLEDWMEGIPEIQNNSLLYIYPNPVSDELKIHRNVAINNQIFQIFNSTGQMIYDKVNMSDETIDTRQLPNGIYLLKSSDGNKFITNKFVVQH